MLNERQVTDIMNTIALYRAHAMRTRSTETIRKAMVTGIHNLREIFTNPESSQYNPEPSHYTEEYATRLVTELGQLLVEIVEYFQGLGIQEPGVTISNPATNSNRYDKQRERIEMGEGGDRDIPYEYQPFSGKELRALARLMGDVQSGKLVS